MTRIKPRQAAFWSVLVVLSLAGPQASASEFACRLPRELLCEGCAQNVTISLQRGGSCRVSFTPATGAPPAATEAKGQLELRIVSAPNSATSHGVATRKRVSAPPKHCFVFNSKTNCE